MAVKGSTPGDQRTHRVRAFGDECTHGVDVTQPCTRDERVLQMLLGRVIVRERRGDAALRPSRRALLHLAFRDEDDPTTGTPNLKRGGQTRDTGPDDDRVGLDGPTGGRRPQRAHGPTPSVTGTLSISRVSPMFTATRRRASPAAGAGPRSGARTAT